jgi:hypothetical protein
MNMQTPGIGDNTQAIDYAAEETDRLRRDYTPLADSVEQLLASATAIPLPIAGPDDKAVVAKTIKDLRDMKQRVEGVREIEKIPHLRRGQAVDQFFGALRIALLKDNKRDRDAIGDTLQAALTDYDNKLLAEEQERRRLAAEKAAREAREKAAAEAKAREEAEAKRLAAERAKLAETKAAKAEVADKADETASVATIEAKLAETKAEEAYVETLARPADIMRNRGADGVMTTMAKEKFAEITDVNALDIVALRPFIKIEALEQALRGLAASRGYSNDERMQISGAIFGTRNKSQVR